MGKYRVETEDGHTYEIETEGTPAEQMGGPGAPAVHPPSLPPELAGKPTFGQAMRNLPRSLINAATHPVFPGAPAPNPQIEGEYHGPTPESVSEEVKSFARPFLHPLQSLAEDPAGTALTLAGTARGAAETAEPIARTAYGAAKGAAQEGFRTTPYRIFGHEMRVPAFVAGGAAGELVSYPFRAISPKASLIGAGVGAAAPFIKGAVEGGKAAYGKYARELQDLAFQDANKPIVQKALPPASPQEAASQNTHMPDVTQADEFKPPNVQPPERTPGGGIAMPGQVQPPVAAPTALQAQPLGAPGTVTPAVQPNEPTPLETPANGKPILPVSSGAKVSGGETPSGPEIIKPGSQPPGEELIPKKPDEIFSQKDKNRQELLDAIEEYKKKHLNLDEPQFARTESGRVKLGADVTSLGNILGSSLYSKGASGVITKELMQNAYDAIRGVKGGEVQAKYSEPGKWVEISDNGKGMTADDLATVFTDLGASGKRGEAGASGGFGLAKAAPLMMSDKLELRTVSRDPSGKLMEHVFNTSKADLLGEGSEVQSKEVPEGTPTGTTIRAYLGKNFDQWQIRNFIQNANRSVKAPGKVIGKAEYKRAFTDRGFPLAPGDEQSYEGKISGEELEPAKHLMQTVIPGSAKVDIYASPPKSFGQGEAPSPQGSVDIEVNNNGIFQFDYPIYFGGDVKVAGLPKRIAIDVQATVPEGDPNYPFSANRETLREDIRNQVKTIIEDKFIKPAKKQYIDFLAQKYNSLPELTKNIPLYDSGNRLTLKEKYGLMQNEDFVNVAKRIDEVAREAISRAQASGHMGEIGKSIEKVGIVFAPEIHGVYVPRPGAQERTATIFINPLSFKAGSSPYQIASLIWHTIKHEILHDQISGHYEEFTSGEASLSHAIGEYELSAIQSLKGAYAPTESNTLRPGIDKALRLYEDSRSREASERDIFGGENLGAGRREPGSRRESETGSRLPSGGKGTVQSPKSVSSGAPGRVMPPK